MTPHGPPLDVKDDCTHYKKVLIDNKAPVQMSNLDFEEWLTLEIFRGLEFGFTHVDPDGSVSIFAVFK